MKKAPVRNFLLWILAASGSCLAQAPLTAGTNDKPGAITLPAGTHLLTKLVSPLHTTSSTAGSGVYLEIVFPVIAGDRVLIPEHTRVLGSVIDERRPGRVSGRAQLQVRCTELVLPDNHVVAISAGLQSLPGSAAVRTVRDNGTLEPVDQIDADVATVAKGTAGGMLLGSLSRHGAAGTGYGALIGGGLGLSKVLFTRGDSIHLPVGTKVEFVLQEPVAVPFSPAAESKPPDDLHPQPARPPQVSSAEDRNLPCLKDGKTLRCIRDR